MFQSPKTLGGLKEIEQTPGPGDYNQPEKEQKGVTIGKRINDKRGEDLQAPGQYKVRFKIWENMSFKSYIVNSFSIIQMKHNYFIFIVNDVYKRFKDIENAYDKTIKYIYLFSIRI